MAGESVTNSDTANQSRLKRYWRANARVTIALLAVWLIVSLGFGILLRPKLDQWSLGGAPLGFWFAQQGAIFVFVAIIFIYATILNAIEADLRRRARDAP